MTTFGTGDWICEKCATRPDGSPDPNYAEKIPLTLSNYIGLAFFVMLALMIVTGGTRETIRGWFATVLDRWKVAADVRHATAPASPQQASPAGSPLRSANGPRHHHPPTLPYTPDDELGPSFDGLERTNRQLVKKIWREGYIDDQRSHGRWIDDPDRY
jgi:hypothetical protein